MGASFDALFEIGQYPKVMNEYQLTRCEALSEHGY